MNLNFGTISFFLLFGVTAIIFVFIIAKTYQNYTASQNKMKAILFGLAMLGFWLFISFLNFLSNAVYLIGLSHSVTPPTGKLNSAIISVLLIDFMWIVGGLILIYFSRRRF